MFYNRKITIPAAGERVTVNQAGLAVVVNSVPIYESVEDRPLLYFDDFTNPAQDLNPGDTLVPNEQGEQFQRVIIEGTEASAGDDLYLKISTVCMDQEVNPVTNNTFKLVPGATFTKTAGNTVLSFSELELANAEGILPSRVDVSVAPGTATDGIKWALNADPGQGDDTIGTVLKPGANGNSGLIEIPGSSIFAFRFISANNTQTEVVNITPYY